MCAHGGDTPGEAPAAARSTPSPHTQRDPAVLSLGGGHLDPHAVAGTSTPGGRWGGRGNPGGLVGIGADHASLCMEAFGFLVVPPVFKTGEIEYLGLAGSIPVRLRQPWTRGGT